MNLAGRGLALAAAAADPVLVVGPAQLLVVVALTVVSIVGLITWLKLHPFVALTLGSAVLALGAGTPADKVFTSFGKGFGATATDVGILIALGAMIGKLLQVSGGAERLVESILSRTGDRSLPWAMALIAFVVGIPMFFEVGLVLLMPVVLLVAQRGGHSRIRVGIPALAGLSVLHGLVPPHPGPLIAVNALHANLGLTVGLGLLVAVPTVALAGPLFSNVAARAVRQVGPTSLAATPRPASSDTSEPAHRPQAKPDTRAARPSLGVTLVTILLPVVLMLGRTLAESTLPSASAVRATATVVGSPLVALLVATLVAMWTLGLGAGRSRAEVSAIVASALPPTAGILLIVGAGGGFKQTIVDTGVAAEIARVAGHLAVSPLLVGWGLAVAVRLATGSATVATTTAAAIVAPLAVGLSPARASLLVLAVGSGSLFFSHVNDAGFWLVKEYFGLTVAETLRTWSVMETVISLVGLFCALLLGVVL